MREAWIAIAFVALLSAPAALTAQRPEGPRGVLRLPAAVRGAMPAELALRLREQLALSEAQVAQLEALRREGVDARRAALGELLEAQSRVRAGEATPETLLRLRADRMETERARRQQSRERLEQILTDEQQQRLRRAALFAERRRAEAGRPQPPGARPRPRSQPRPQPRSQLE